MSNSTDPVLVDTYRFTPTDLNAGDRLPGVSAFMRIKNGADFLEAAIRTHIGHVDEIVAVYNQSSDGTAGILARLAVEFGPKLRVFHYLPKVHAPGSEAHAREAADSPASFVNQSNFALARTKYRVVMKLDDDHLAMEPRLTTLTQRIRMADYRLPEVLCFSGINLACDETGKTGALASEPFVGGGDHFFFEVTPETRFIHNSRFEDFHHDRRRVFADLTYWHLKYLKPDFGFANRDISAGGNPRFARKQQKFLADRRVISLADLRSRAPTLVDLATMVPLPEKARLKVDRWRRFLAAPPEEGEMRDILQRAKIQGRP